MFVAFHADAYFSMGGEVLLYFIVWVDVIVIQILFEFKLVWNLERIWKLKTFSSFYWPWAEFHPTGPAEPASASLVCGPGPVVSYSASSHHREGNATDRNLNRIKGNIESLLNLKAWR
jgi:hypothetical protein